MATENILMETVKKGGNRQHIHELLRQLSHNEYKKVKNGDKNQLITKIKEHEDFHLIKDELDNILDIKRFTGRASEQIAEYIETTVDEVLNEYNKEQEKDSKTNEMIVNI